MWAYVIYVNNVVKHFSINSLKKYGSYKSRGTGLR